MWILTTPWYELMIRASCVYFFSLIIFRIWGKKHLGEMTPFDFILLLFISEAISNSLSNGDLSIPGGMIVVLTFIFWDVCLDKLTYYSRKLERIVEGGPIILIRDGKIMEDILFQQQITKEELAGALRLGGVLEARDVKQATLETNGHISVIPNKN